MNALSFLRYALVSVVRNRRRSLFAMVGIALSTSLVAGSLIAVDTSASSMLHMAIGPTTVDFVGKDYNYSPDTSYDLSSNDQAVGMIESVNGIDEATYWLRSNGWSLRNSQGHEYLSYLGESYLAFASPDSPLFLKANNIHGEMPAQGSAAIPKSVALGLGIGIGDEIVCSLEQISLHFDPVLQMRVYDLAYLNLTFPVSQIWTQDKSVAQYQEDRPDLQDEKVVYLNNIDGFEPVVFSLVSYPTVMNSTALEFLSSTSSQPELSYLVWTDRDTVISIADIQGSIDRLESIQAQLNEIGSLSGFYVGDSRLENQLRGLDSDLESMKYLFLELSLPVSALGVYLSVIGVDMGANSRRREAGILKARGASNRLVMSYLVIEAGILGASASFIGLLLGVVVSRLLFGAVPSFSAGGTSSDSFWTVLNIGPMTIELAMLFGISLMFISSFRSFSKISAASVRESIHHYSTLSAREDYSPDADIVLISFSLLSVASILITADAALRSGWSWLTELILGSVLMWGILLFPFMPFFLSFGVVRLLTRGSRKLYSRFAWFVRPWTKELHNLVRRNILRNPRRASNLGVLIALALASGLFVSVTMESTIAYQRSVVTYSTGSDMKVESHWYGRGVATDKRLNLSKLSDLNVIEGVRATSSNIVLNARLPQSGASADVWMAVINSADYERTVKPSDRYFIGGGSSLLEELKTNGTALVAQHVLSSYYLVIGDLLRVNISYSYWSQGILNEVSHEFLLTVIGAVKGMPGLSSADMYVDTHSMEWLFAQNIGGAAFYVDSIISLSRGTDPHGVGDAAASVFAEAGLEPKIYIAADLIARAEHDPGDGALRGYLYMEYALSIVIVFVGVSLLIFVSVGDRERELACIIARGSSSSQMRRILMGESVTLMILGVVIGSLVGLLAAYLFNTLNPSSLVPRTMEFAGVSWAMLIVSIVSILLSSLLATMRAGKVRLAEVLRIRGG
ncbi:MAG: FtsX-like permease family protein [Thermoplasmatota archaeon]|nr:FtsX-like permease family protein [Candidatus Thermoplasmatota archaeon]MBU1914891.1 FtsX-like permease family protein [Candidatus Thermoplasmatota archaeon]